MSRCRAAVDAREDRRESASRSLAVSAQALCARLAAEGRSAALGAATAVVCWWRFDFAAFAAPLGLYCVASSSKSTAKAIATGLATFAAGAGLLVLGDTLYFNSIDGSVVVAPVCKST